MAVESFTRERVYVKAESSFNDTAYTSLAAGDAIIARSCALQVAHNRVPSKSKRGTPDVITDLPRMQTSGFDVTAEWRPSGTLGTESDLGPLFKSFFGSQSLAGSGSGVTTTVSASPSPTATGCTVASATGISVGDIIIVTTSNGREATRVKTKATNALTYDALSAAPATGAAVVAGVTYGLTTAVGQSLAIARFFASKKECVTGAQANSLEVTFGKQDEVIARFSGMSAQHRGNAAATSLSDPSTTTVVGSPLNGIIGIGIVNGYTFKVTSARFSMNNALALRDQDIGQSYATEAFRNDFRDGTVEISFYLDDHRVADLGYVFTKAAFSLVLGSTNGAMLAAVAPSVLWDEPALPAGESGVAMMTIRGQLFATSTGNDSLFLGEL